MLEDRFPTAADIARNTDLNPHNASLRTNDKNIKKKIFPLAKKFFGFAEKTEKFL